MSLELLLKEQTEATKLSTEATLALLTELQAQREERKEILAGLDLSAAAQPAPTKRGAGRPKKEDATQQIEGLPEKISEPVIQTVTEQPVVAAAAPVLDEPTLQDLRDAAKKFVGVADAEVKAARQEFLRNIMDHLGTGLNDEGKRVITNVDSDQRAQVIAWFDEFTAKGKVNFRAAEPTPVVPEDDDDIG